MKTSKLTYLQKTALKGELALALSTSAHNTDIKYRTYLILKEVAPEYRAAIVECLKEMITFEESELDRIYLEVQNGTTPVWLWIEECIADIKFSLSTADPSLKYTRISIESKKVRETLIESSFISFARKAILISPEAAEQLFNEILEDQDLEFLSTSCAYLKDSCSEVKAIKRLKSTPSKIMNHSFDIKNILNFNIETKTLSIINNEEEPATSKTEWAEPSNPVIIEGPMSHEQIAQCISNKIAELFGEAPNPSTSKSATDNVVYVVKKVFTDSGLSTDIRECKTKEEALNFIKDIEKKYPELASVCEFKVHTEKINDREKEKWKKI
jgi:hypothetical protein